MADGESREAVRLRLDPRRRRVAEVPYICVPAGGILPVIACKVFSKVRGQK